MASYDTTKISLGVIKQYKTNFDQEVSRFKNATYNTFSSSYINSCTDVNIRQMAHNLDSLYKRIGLSYGSISKWWGSYNENAEGLENSLSSDNHRGSITEASLRNLVNSKLSNLDDYKISFGGTFSTPLVINNVVFANNTVLPSFANVGIAAGVGIMSAVNLTNEVDFAQMSSTVGTYISNASSKAADIAYNSGIKIASAISNVGTFVSSLGLTVNNNITAVVDDVSVKFAKVNTYVSTKSKTAWNDFASYTSEFATVWAKAASDEIHREIESTKAAVATAAVAVQSLLWGVANFGEALYDLINLVAGAIATVIAAPIDLVTWISGGDAHLIEDIWGTVKGEVSKQYVNNFMTNIYDNTAYGAWLKEYSYIKPDGTVANVLKGVGYVAGVTVLTVATCGVGGIAMSGTAASVSLGSSTVTITSGAVVSSAIATGAGIGKNTEKAWNEGAGIFDGLKYGAIMGAWDGSQYLVGGAVNTLKVLGGSGLISKGINSLARVIIDASGGAAEVVINPLAESVTYKDESFDELFKANGGSKAVLTNALVGASFSSLSEMGDSLSRVINAKKFANISDVNSSVEIDNEVLIDNQNLTSKVKSIFNLKEKGINFKKLNINQNIIKGIGKVVFSIPNTFVVFANKFNAAKVLKSAYMADRIADEGLIHVCSDLTANKIVESGFVKASSRISSYSPIKKSFFFAGTPSFAAVCSNIKNIDQVLTAVKIRPTANQLDNLSFRYANDLAVMNKGKFVFDKDQAEIVHFGLTMENGKIFYKPLKAEEVINYKANFSINLSNKFANLLQQIKGGFPFELNTVYRLYDAMLNDFKVGKLPSVDNIARSIGKYDDSIRFVKRTESKIVLDSGSVKGINEKGIDLVTFKTMSDSEQLRLLEESHVNNISSLLGDDNFSSQYFDLISRKIIDNQDYIFTSGFKDVINLKVNSIISYVSGNVQIIKKLSDNNLIKLLANCPKDSPNLKIILDEAENRIDNGNALFDHCALTKNLFGTSMSDSSLALSKMPNSLQQKMFDIAKKEWENVPQNIKNCDFEYGTFYQQILLARMIKDGTFDDGSLKILMELNGENKKNLQIFNFEMLNAKIVDSLGIDFVKEIGKYDELSTKVVSLYNNNKNLFASFSDIVRKSKTDDSLSIFYIKTKCCLDFFFKNSDQLKTIDNSMLVSDDFMNYVLYRNYQHRPNTNLSEEMNIDFTGDYAANFAKKCDEIFDLETSKYEKAYTPYLKDIQLSNMKDIYFQKYFSISYDDAKTLLSKYGDHINEVLKYDVESEASTILNLFKSVNETSDVNYLSGLYNNQKFSLTAEEMLSLDNKIKKVYGQSYVETLSDTSAKIKEAINNNSTNVEKVIYNGKEVKMVNVNDSFSFLVYSSDTGFVVKDRPLVNNSYIDTWKSGIDPKAHALPASYINSENIGSAPVQGNGVLYGFMDIKADDIAIMAPYDVNSNIANYGFTSGNKQVYISAEEMPKNSLRVYNEFVLDRQVVKPSCIILYDNATDNSVRGAIKAAAEWDIPVVKISKVKLAQQQNARIDNLITQFKENKDVNVLKETIDLYEANVSGYKLNSNVLENAADATASINNDIVAHMFNSNKIDNIVVDYIDELQSLDNNKEKVSNLIEVLESVKAKYNLVNTQGTKLVANTKASFEIDTLIDLAKELLEE